MMAESKFWGGCLGECLVRCQWECSAITHPIGMPLSIREPAFWGVGDVSNCFFAPCLGKKYSLPREQIFPASLGEAFLYNYTKMRYANLYN